MKLRLILFLLASTYGYLFSQEFQTTFYLVNDHGSKDSVTIGYDPAADDGIDPAFGEVDLSDLLMENFEIRTGQVNNEQLIYFDDLEHPSLDTLSQYLGKREIIPKNCLSHIPVSNQAGFLATINLFIKTESYPVSVKWNKEAFNNACLSMSFITDWPIATWWDIPCCNPLDFGEVLLEEKDSITLYYHSGINLTDQQGDTITMLTILLNDEFGTATNDLKKSNGPKIFPNPSNGSFSIPDDWQLLKLSNSMGSSVDYTIDDFTIHTSFTGIIFITLRKKSEILVLKHVNNLR